MIKKTVKEKYSNLTKEQLLNKVEEIGGGFEKNSYSCSQSTIAAIDEVVGLSDDAVRCATSMCAGISNQLIGPCGGLVGGIMAIDYFFGRNPQNMDFETLKEENTVPVLAKPQGIAKELFLKYIDHYGTIQCASLMFKKYARLYYMDDPDEMKKFFEVDSHSNVQTNCPSIVGWAARTTMELLIDNGAVILKN